MKKLLFICTLCTLVLQGTAQQLMPMQSSHIPDNETATLLEIKDQFNNSNQLPDGIRNLATLELADSLKSVTDESKLPNTAEKKNELNQTRNELMRMIENLKIPNLGGDGALKKFIDKKIGDSLRKIDSSKWVYTLKILNNEPDFWVSGVGGVSNLESIGQAGGNFSISTKFRLGRFHRMGKKSKWVDPAYLYMAFNTRTNSSEDSGSMSKSFLFPDISKRDFVIGFYYNFRQPNTGWNIDPIIEFSLNRYKTVKDSISKSFRSESALVGVRISKNLSFNISNDSSYDAGFFLFPYYSIINVQGKNFADYHTIMGTGKVPATIHSIGLQAGINISKLQLFANMKYVLTPAEDEGLPDLQGFTYTIGTVVAVDILRFKLSK